jgi:hypothetical protein
MQIHQISAGTVNNFERPMNGSGRNERPHAEDERQRNSPSAIAPGFAAIPRTPPRRVLRKATVGIIVGFWLIYFLGTTAMILAMNPSETRNLYVPRAIVSVGGIVISFLMIWVQYRIDTASLSRRAMVALAMAFIAPLVHFYLNFVVFAQFFPRWTPGLPGLAEFTQDYLFRFWIFASLSGIVLALSYAGDIREREERIHALQALAHSAQIRALRNQLNPHFLFNALNSIVSLISRDRGGEAEMMTENLADFLRTTLALDPEKVVALDDELRLLELYLAIEKVRFPDRLKVLVDVPDELRSVEIPALITQPLIENSIKYAVARSTRPVELQIHARIADGRLELVIEDDGGDADEQRTKGARMGLSNVTERLAAHYGEDAKFEARPDGKGGFVNIIAIPLRSEQ